MKKILKYIIAVFILVCGFNAFAQENLFLDKFTVFEVQGKVHVNCTISSGNTCNGINVLRSEDSIYFELIANIEGICGSSLSPVSYNFVDENPPKNKTVFYKLEFGGYGFTNVLSIQIIDTKEFGFQIRPNPANEKAIIYFENNSNNPHSLMLVDNLGNIVLHQNTNNNFFELSLDKIPSGIYPFIISIDSYNIKASGKIVIHH